MKPEKTQVLRNLEGHQSIRTKEPFENHHGVSRDLPAEKAFLLLFFFEKAWGNHLPADNIASTWP